MFAVFQHLFDDLVKSSQSIVQVFSRASSWIIPLCSDWCRPLVFAHFWKCWSDSLNYGIRKKHSKSSFYSSQQCLLLQCIFYNHLLLNNSVTVQSHYTLNNLLLTVVTRYLVKTQYCLKSWPIFIMMIRIGRKKSYQHQ